GDPGEGTRRSGLRPGGRDRGRAGCDPREAGRQAEDEQQAEGELQAEGQGQELGLFSLQAERVYPPRAPWKRSEETQWGHKAEAGRRVTPGGRSPPIRTCGACWRTRSFARTSASPSMRPGTRTRACQTARARPRP